MANGLKMVQKELLFTLFSQDWSIRKINIASGIHRKTITRYLDEWRHLQDKNSQLSNESLTSNPAPFKELLSVQSVALGPNEVPTDKMVHFQVPFDRCMSAS